VTSRRGTWGSVLIVLPVVLCERCSKGHHVLICGQYDVKVVKTLLILSMKNGTISRTDTYLQMSSISL
jgi:hypothetical protein